MKAVPAHGFSASGRFGAAAAALLAGLVSVVPARSTAHAQAVPAAAVTQAAPAVPLTAPTSALPGNTTAPTSYEAGQQPRTAAETIRTATDRTAALPTPPPTEFQRLVRESTGQELPVFGAGLFGPTPSTFAPVDDVPVTPDYVLGPGDEIRLQIWGQVNQQQRVTVDRTGSISLPDLGAVHVAGLHYAQLTEFLRAQLGRVYRNFDLNVNLGQLRSIQVFVVGEARQPGSYTVSSLSTLLNALFASGGPLPQGSLRDIQLRRGNRTVVHFDLYDLLLHGDKSSDAQLAAGDVVFIPPVGPQVAVLGSVTTPAIYELRDESRGVSTVREVLELSGGRTSTAAGSSVRIERIFEHQLRSVLNVDLATAPDTPLGNGDVVLVASIVDRFRNAVTLRGNVANPGRYAWHEGMRVTDLVPNRESLITREYWNRRNALGQTGIDYQADRSAQGSLQLSQSPGTTTSAPAVTPTSPAIAPATPRRGSTSNAGGNSVGVALASNSSVFSATTDVVLSAPDIDWSYAVIERQDPVTLKTTLLPFNLGKIVLDGDSSQDLALLPNDVVTIFSTADLRVPGRQQTRFVRLEGEFLSAGVYSVRPGEHLRDLIARAGGFTPEAYLYASEFTRESTRRVQQQRLNDYADQLEAQVTATTADAAATSLNDRATAAAEASATAARAAITRLRQLQPVGRIVLQLRPDDRTADALPDLELEDGDRFVVPRVPANVNVEGQVYSANAFVFERKRRSSFYLREAGGPDRLADRKRAFILRADGSVFNRQYGNVEHANIFPGDTIVVPPRITNRALLRNIVDLSNVVGQLGFGIAAISLIQ